MSCYLATIYYAEDPNPDGYNFIRVAVEPTLNFIQGAIQCLRGQEEVGRWFQKCSFLSTFRVKIVYVEVGR